MEQQKGQNTIRFTTAEPADDDRCMLDPNKMCDNCFRCLEQNTHAYAEIRIDGIYLSDDDLMAKNDGHIRDDAVAAGGDGEAGRPVRLHLHPMTIRGYSGKRHREDG